MQLFKEVNRCIAYNLYKNQEQLLASINGHYYSSKKYSFNRTKFVGTLLLVFSYFVLTCLLKLVYNWTSFRTFATKPIAVATSKPNTFLEPTSVGNALTSLERRTLSGNTNWCVTKTRSNSGLTFSCETNLTKYRKTWKTNQTWINCESRK
jgi:hypothetical protein